MALTYLFLDTEWSDTQGRELVSLALVSADGVSQFYVEIDPLPLAPTDFVKTTVYPLLDRSPAVTMTKAQLTAGLRRFLTAIPEPCLIADYQNDLALAQQVLAGFPDPVASNLGP